MHLIGLTEIRLFNDASILKMICVQHLIGWVFRFYIAASYGSTLHGWHAFTTAGMRLKQKFSFSNVWPGRVWTRSLMAVDVTTRLRRTPIITMLPNISQNVGMSCQD